MVGVSTRVERFCTPRFRDNDDVVGQLLVEVDDVLPWLEYDEFASDGVADDDRLSNLEQSSSNVMSLEQSSSNEADDGHDDRVSSSDSPLLCWW